MEKNRELSELACNWLLATGNKINAKYCKENINSHTDYPALTAVTDFLETGNMEYDAVQADASYIHEFNYPLLAHINHPAENFFYLIQNAAAWEKEKEITQKWDGIVLYAGKNAKWQNVENEVVQKNANKNKLTAGLFMAAGLITFIISVFIYPAWIINIFGGLALIGFALSIIALGTELGFQSKIVKQVCGTISNGGCEKVLKSSFAKGFAGITPADISVLYFGTQFFIYLAACFFPNLSGGIINIAFAGIIAAAWSIYTQGVKIKKWCAICICIASVLTLQFFTAFVYSFNFAGSFSLVSYPVIAVVMAALAMVFFPVKKLIKINRTSTQELLVFKKWKRDASLFLLQLVNEPFVNTNFWGNDIILGNRNAPLCITIACNPYCTPCAKSHKMLDDILDKYPGKVNAQVKLMYYPSDPNNLVCIASKTILQQAMLLKDNNSKKEMLADWFEWMDMDKWQQKWKPGAETDISALLNQHANWMEENNITHTPTVFLNGKKLPGRYEVTDLKYMIPQLEAALAEQVK